MNRFRNKQTALFALIASIVLIASLLLGTACIGPLGCGLMCTACGSACSDSCGGLTDPSDEPMWDGPGSIRETPASGWEPEAVVTAAPETAAPATPASDSPFGQQVSAVTPAPDTPAAAAVREKRVQLKNDGTDTVTVLVLMNGSDLESEYQEATADITEMVRAQKSDRVNILLETVGTKRWDRRYGISSNRSERYRVTDRGITLVDGSLGQLDTTVPSTLSDFIRWGAQNYPADRYILLLWDHGGGPVYGFGYDEYQSYESTLTIDEIQLALRDGGVYFDLIGMDCCLMSSIEVCCALYEYCDYTLLSEDFEPGCGWSHSGWLSALAKNPAIPTPDLAKIAIDDSVRFCEANLSNDGGTTLALMDESYMKLLYAAWVDFAYDNEDALLNANYSQLRQSTGRAHPRMRSISDWFLGDGDDYTLSDYCITDALSLAENIESDKADAFTAALNASIVYFGRTSDETTLTGLSVTLPYGDREFYNELKRVFRNAGFDTDYIDWLGKFVSVQIDSDHAYDFDDWGDLWGGWGTHDTDYDWDDWTGPDGDWSDDGWADDDWGDDWSDLFGWLFGR